MPNEVMREQVARWTEQRLAEWAAPRLERSRAEGRAEGRTEGRTEVMRRQVARKFGTETADQFVKWLAALAKLGRVAKLSDLERSAGSDLERSDGVDLERSAGVGEWILECVSGEELLDRMAELCKGEILREEITRWADRHVAEWAAPQMEHSRAEGQAEGRMEGRTEVMRRQVARKFGTKTADRLAERLAKIPDPERLGEVGEWLLDCESGKELLDRVARLCETAAAEDCAAQG